MLSYKQQIKQAQKEERDRRKAEKAEKKRLAQDEKLRRQIEHDTLVAKARKARRARIASHPIVRIATTIHPSKKKTRRKSRRSKGLFGRSW